MVDIADIGAMATWFSSAVSGGTWDLGDEVILNMSDSISLYVSVIGNNAWSGSLPEPNTEGSDGPLATIGRARDIVREMKASGKFSCPVAVWIRGGRYVISEPITFGPEDSAPVRYAAYPGELPVIDGGKRIDGWREETLNGSRVWIADLPQVLAGKWYFRQLFVNGRRAKRASLPKNGFYHIENAQFASGSGGNLADVFVGSDTFKSAPGDIHEWSNLSDADIVILHYWLEERIPIAEFSNETHTVKLSRKTLMAMRGEGDLKYARYYVDNVFEALSEPGEWYLDRKDGKLYYIPLAEELVETAEIFAPCASQLLKVVGKPEENSFVEFLRFEGICFEHTDYQPGIEITGTTQASFAVPGVVLFEGARYCAIEGCTIRHIGYYGIELSHGCKSCRIINNEISDMGAGGIKINGSHAKGPVHGRTGLNVATDNHIYAGGRIFHSAVGILSAHAFGNTLSHNHIHDLFYTGISCGWVWGYGDNVSMNNTIEKNYIHDVGQGMLSDNGGIYAMGVQPGTVIRGNVVCNITSGGYGGFGIYLDEGSSYMVIEDNICFRTSSTCFELHYGYENIVRNNIFAFGAKAQVALSRADDKPVCTFQRNIFVVDNRPVFVGGYALRLQDRQYFSDLNLFWDKSQKPVVSGTYRPDIHGCDRPEPALSIENWQGLGNDLHSVVADPLFKSLDSCDFILSNDSPAFNLSFRPIDASDVGPRRKAV